MPGSGTPPAVRQASGTCPSAGSGACGSRDFSFRGQDGWARVDIGRITTKPRLASLLGGSPALEHTVIDRPKVAIDLRHRPPATGKGPTSLSMDSLARLNDVVVRDGSIELTDTGGKTVQLASLDSTLNMRPAGPDVAVRRQFGRRAGANDGPDRSHRSDHTRQRTRLEPQGNLG